MEDLYIKEGKYFGFLTKRPLIPKGEVWVFHRWDGECYVLRGMEDDALPPPPPLLERHATIIYKFRRKVDFSWSITLFVGSGLSTTIDTNVTLFLHDPVEFMGSKQFKTIDRMAIESILSNTLRGPLSGEVPTTDMQAISSGISNIVPLALSQLLPETDLSYYIQGLHEFRECGLEARVIVRKTDIPEAYKKLMHDVTLAIQEQLLQVKSNMIEALAGLEIEKLQTGARFDLVRQAQAFNEELYRSQMEAIEHLLLKVRPTIEEIIQQTGNVPQQSMQTALATTIFNDILLQTIEQITQGTATSQFPGSTPLVISHRDIEIQTLYQGAESKGWKLVPSQSRMKEEINIDLGSNSKLLLTVPKAYPAVKPVVTGVKKQGIRVPQSEINTVTQAATARSYDLSMLVQAVVDALA